MKKILITGANGFIGRNLCRECRERGLAYIPVYGRRAAEAEGAEKPFHLNLEDAQEVDALIQTCQPDVIVHLAAIASPVFQDIGTIYRVNVGGSENLLSAAAKLNNHCRVILISTAGVYGNQDISRLHEELPFNPVNHYSYSKMVMEVMSRQYADRLDLHIVRPFNIIGTNQTQGFLIPKLIRHFAEQAPQIELGNLTAVRDYVSVKFCVRVLVDCAVSEGPLPPVLNICSGVGHSCLQVIEILEQLTKHTLDIIQTATLSRPNEIWNLVGDPQRLNTVVQNRYASARLEEILATMLEDYHTTNQ